MALNQTLYLTNPANGASGIVAGSGIPVTVVNNSAGTEPLKLVGLKVSMITPEDISVDFGSTVITLATSASGLTDLMPLLPYSTDTNGQKYLIIQAGASLRVDTNVVGNNIIYQYESFEA